ncbi:hypothetical protein ACT048_22970 [Ectopseudomonas khazarica]|uniref:hypothetical protein n=1 Tax=Ectopseudomonas khazarica TaxID=2502979 RepID=UPI0015C7DE9A
MCAGREGEHFTGLRGLGAEQAAEGITFEITDHFEVEVDLVHVTTAIGQCVELAAIGQGGGFAVDRKLMCITDKELKSSLLFNPKLAIEK